MAGEVAPGIETAIVNWYVSQLPPPRAYRPQRAQAAEPATARFELPEDLAADPAGKFFLTFVRGQMPDGIEQRAAAVAEGLKTEQRSLALSALMWRALLEPCLAGDGPGKRSQQVQQTLGKTLAALRKATLAWRRQIIDEKLDPFLARDRDPLRYHFEMSKAMRRPPPWLVLVRDTQEERWGRKKYHPKTRRAEVTAEFLAHHAHAQDMRLNIIPAGDNALRIMRGEESVSLEVSTFFGVFDLLVVPSPSSGRKIRLTSGPDGSELEIVLPASSQITYIDLLRLAYEQNRETMDKLFAEAPYHPNQRGWGAIVNPLLLMPFYQLPRHNTTKGRHSIDHDDVRKHFLADFWLF